MQTDPDKNDRSEFRAELRAKPKTDLTRAARSLKLKGRSGLTKEELITLLAGQEPDRVRRALRPGIWHRFRGWLGRHHPHVYGFITVAGLILTVAFFVVRSDTEDTPRAAGPGSTLWIGGKNFLESSILAEIIFLRVKRDHPEIDVKVKHGLRETVYCVYQTLKGEIHIYPEYTGTILAQHLSGIELDKGDLMPLQKEAPHELEEVQRRVDRSFLRDLAFVADFGFHNGYTLVMTKGRLRSLGLSKETSTITEVAAKANGLTVIGDSEALVRPDCLGGLATEYTQFTPKSLIESETHSEIYDRLRIAAPIKKEGEASEDEEGESVLIPEADIAIGFTTDVQLLPDEGGEWAEGHEDDGDFVQLRDDKDFFIRYYAGPFVHKQALQDFPGLEATLRGLSNLFAPDGGPVGSIGSRQEANTRMMNLIKEVTKAGIRVETLAAVSTTQEDLRKLIKLEFPELN